MEQKLAEFRARRLAENMAKKDKCAGPPCRTETVDDGVKFPQTDRTTTPPPPTTPASQKTSQETENRRDSPQSSPRKDRSDWLLDSSVGRWLASRQLVITNLTLLKVLLWLVLLGLFVELEFGLPFFVISLFYWLYEGLRSPAAREPGELSAYSVFNPDCQPLLGTLTAEQLEGEMGYRPLTNR